MKILMFYHGGSRNRGCEAIIRSSVPLIHKHIPNAQISLASFAPETDRHIQGLHQIIDASRVGIKKYSAAWFINAFNVKVLGSDNYAHRKYNKNIIEQIPHHDVFLSVGGDNYCYGEQPWLYEVDRCIKKAGKKLVLWGASIGAEDLSAYKVEDLKTQDLLLVRETLTQQTLEQNGVKNVKLVADSAFTMAAEQLPLPKGWKEGNTLGFNYSALVWKRKKDSLQASVELIRHILNTTEMAVALTPHVVIPGNDDNEVLLEILTSFKDNERVFLLPDTLDAVQYKGYISRMRFFIGARTHATIAAYSNSVPTMVLGYSVKSKGIATDIFGSPRLVLGIEEISDAKALIDKFEELKRDEAELRQILDEQIPRIKEMADKAGMYLAQLAR